MTFLDVISGNQWTFEIEAQPSDLELAPPSKSLRTRITDGIDEMGLHLRNLLTGAVATTRAPFMRPVRHRRRRAQVEMSSEEKEFHHIPVMKGEICDILLPSPGKVIVDCTLGGGGHTEMCLREGAIVIGLDQDDDAIAAASARLEKFGERFQVHKSNFRNLRTVLDEVGIEKVDGILLDIGISSWQVDSAERGFSFQKDGPLDMRMNRDIARTAADWVNDSDPAELKRIFQQYGEERSAGKIVQAIVKHREREPFVTTLDLADAIEKVKPRRGRAHPATKVFQALRIAVNDELGALEDTLEQTIECLKPGGVLAVISFHSLEDRMVKRFFRRTTKATIDRPEWPEARPNPEYYFENVRRKAIAPSEDEIEINPRARSAKLRAAIRN